MIKMIVVDLDGTLLNKDRKITNDTKNYLKELKSKGYIITIATGRIYASALNATDGAEFVNYMITDTGSCIYDLSSSIPLLKNRIKKETVKKILQYYNEDCRYIDISNRDNSYRYCCEESTIEDILNHCEEISHISIAMKSNEAVMRLYEQLIKADIPELDMIIMQDSFSDKKWIEIIPKGCTKYHAIKALANYLNIDNRDIMAFGDGLNDVEMLENCGYGVAMKNALPEVKEVADIINDYDNDHDGVIHFLKQYLDVEKRSK